MLLRRPLRFLLICLCLQVAWQSAIVLLTWWLWATAGIWVRASLCLSLAAGTIQWVVLLAQLPKAANWRPRRSVRPGPEIRRERERIARELHDRVGGHLVNAIALFDPQNPRQALQRNALERGLLELRLLADTMDDPGRTSGEQLAQLRYRMGPVLLGAKLEVEWDIDAADQPGAPNGSLLAVIAQEALSNAIQHAKASHVRVSLHRLADTQQWKFEISDDGVGMAAIPPCGLHRAATGGMGLKNMQERVRAAGGQMQTLAGSSGGTSVQAVF